MKTLCCFLTVTISVLMVVLAGCATNQQSATSSNTNSAATTYSSDDLQRTGKREAGDALRSADPAVTTTTGR